MSTVAERARTYLAQRPRIGHAVKVAVAASLAWAAALLLPGVADEYPYYAPFGAVIAVSSTVAGSIRESAQGVLAILLGAFVARTFDLLLDANLLTLAAAVGVASLIAAWHRLGAMNTWVPVSAVFVLIIGSGDPVDFIVAYGGLTLLGAAIGVGVLLVWPPLPLTPAQVTLTNLRQTLADQLCDLADGLRQEGPLSPDEWAQRRRAIDPVSAEMRAMIQQAAEARRGNRRLNRYRREADRQYEHARALEQLTFLIEDLTLLVAESEHSDARLVAFGPPLRPFAADVLERVSVVLCSVEDATAGHDELQEADRALHAFVDAVRDARSTTADDLFVAGSVVVSLRRCLASVVPENLVGTIPSG